MSGKNRTKITVHLQMTYSADENTLSCVKVASQCDTGSMTAAAAQKSIRLFTCDCNNIYFYSMNSLSAAIIHFTSIDYNLYSMYHRETHHGQINGFFFVLWTSWGGPRFEGGVDDSVWHAGAGFV